jgi:hypothetical protein
MTTWAARRVGDRILCGRRVPPDGPYACMGLIATVVRDVADEEHLRMRPGVVPEWVDGEVGPRYRLTTRARFPMGRQSSPGSGMFRRTRGRPGEVGTRPPLWCPCSHGGHENRAGGGLLPGTPEARWDHGQTDDEE